MSKQRPSALFCFGNSWFGRGPFGAFFAPAGEPELRTLITNH